MMQYFKEILTTFSITQRIWALIILCVSVFLITFGSNIINTLKPDPEQQILIIKRQRNQLTSLNIQLDSLSLRVNDLTQEVINGQTECSHKRIQREKELISQIDEVMNMVKNGSRSQQMVKNNEGTSSSSSYPKTTSDTVEMIRNEPKYVTLDNSNQIIKGLSELKNKIRDKK